MNFGDLATEQRLSLGMTIKEFCLKNSINPVVLSKIERGIQLPNKREMNKFVEALKIYEGSAEHAELLRAYNSFTCNNKFSMNDLPVFLKPGADVEKIVEYMREANIPEDSSLWAS